MMSSSDYRSKCLSFHDEQCILCSSEDDIHVHHVNGDRSDNSLLNLIPVCSSCHSKIHAGLLDRWSDKIESKSTELLNPVVEDESWSITMYMPFEYRKVFAGSRGRVTLGSEYEGEPIGVAITPLSQKQ